MTKQEKYEQYKHGHSDGPPDEEGCVGCLVIIVLVIIIGILIWVFWKYGYDTIT